MTRLYSAGLILGCVAIITACAADEEPEAVQSDTPDDVAQVAAIARAITNAPEAADSILEAHDMTRARFDSLMYEIAMTPELTEAFEAARR